MSQYVSRARALAAGGRIDEAENVLRWAVGQAPADPEVNRALGMMLLERGDALLGASYLHRASESAPHRPDLLYEYGTCLAVADELPAAAAALERSLALVPNAPQTCEILGQVLLQLDQPARAMEVLGRGVQLEPRNPIMARSYFLALKGSGHVGEASTVAEQLASDHPQDAELLMLAAWQATYWEGGDPARIREWLERRGRVLPQGDRGFWHFTNAPEPERRLRVGFLCQDVRRDSPIARFVAPALMGLDREQFDLVGYCTESTLEHMSPRLLGTIECGWADVSRLDDAALVDRIRADRIDILVETAGNTAGNRQVALARRAAPVQVTCIGDPRTTGNPAIDYRIVDEITDPPGSEEYCTERLVRLPGCFLCYEPHDDAPSPRPPLDTDGPGITFGSFNVPDKTGDGVIQLWAEILTQVEGSRLVLKSGGFQTPTVQALYLEKLRKHGIDPARIEMAGHTPVMRDHLSHYHRIDIALDPFPYNGTTTTCDAMWMGVPVVVLAGSWHAARVGASLLTAAGLPELIATDREQYVRVAVDLAADRKRLAGLHAGLRDRMAHSPLRDVSGYAERLGGAYRAMWRAWCAR